MRLDAVKLVAALKKQNLRQKDIVYRTGISQNTISAVFNRKNCSENTAKKIAEALGVTVEELMEEIEW